MIVKSKIKDVLANNFGAFNAGNLVVFSNSFGTVSSLLWINDITVSGSKMFIHFLLALRRNKKGVWKIISRSLNFALDLEQEIRMFASEKGEISIERQGRPSVKIYNRSLLLRPELDGIEGLAFYADELRRAHLIIARSGSSLFVDDEEKFLSQIGVVV